MRDLLKATRDDGTMLWNAPALAALCRPLLDAFLALFYFCFDGVGEDEAGFRRLLLSRHHLRKRCELLCLSDQGNPRIAEETAAANTAWEKAKSAVLEHPCFAKLESGWKKRLTNNEDVYILAPLQEVWARAGLPEALYGVTFRYLSQFAHATPYAVATLFKHEAGNEAGAVNMTIPIGLANTLVGRTASYCTRIDDTIVPLLQPLFDYIKRPVADSHAPEGRPASR